MCAENGQGVTLAINSFFFAAFADPASLAIDVVSQETHTLAPVTRACRAIKNTVVLAAGVFFWGGRALGASVRSTRRHLVDFLVSRGRDSDTPCLDHF